MTEELQQNAETDSQTSTADNVKTRENKKEKSRPLTKVVIRRLPPSMTQEQFLEQVSPLPEYDNVYFAKADCSLGQYAFSRAYIDFVDQQEIFLFRERFDNYVFVDAKGIEYPAVVEYAPFQRLPKKRTKKKDLKCGTIESDPYYITFLESLKSQETDTASTQPKTEFSYQPSDHAPKKVTTTPLLDYLKQRKQEKQRLRDEKREEKRLRNLERKRIKNEPAVSKVLKNPDVETKDKDKEKDFEKSKENKENKEDRDKILPKDAKNRNKKEEQFREKAKSIRDREERAKEREAKHSKKHEEKKFHNRKEEREMSAKEERKYELKEEFMADLKDKKSEEKRGKSYEKMRQEKRRLAEAKRQNIEVHTDESVITSEVKSDEIVSPKKENLSKEDVSLQDKENSKDEDAIASPKSGLNQNTLSDETCPRLTEDKLRSEEEDCASKIMRSSEELSKDSEYLSLVSKRETKRRSSLESGGESGGGDSADLDATCLRRHKSLDGGDRNDLRKNEGDDKKDKKDPRLERRIRNKDRPAMEIYRPGMGKFSKQRMEREKGCNDERSSLSQSPTPSPAGSSTSKSGKSSGSEVRTMTFKRSVSRDIA